MQTARSILERSGRLATTRHTYTDIHSLWDFALNHHQYDNDDDDSQRDSFLLSVSSVLLQIKKGKALLVGHYNFDGVLESYMFLHDIEPKQLLRDDMNVITLQSVCLHLKLNRQRQQQKNDDDDDGDSQFGESTISTFFQLESERRERHAKYGPCERHWYISHMGADHGKDLDELVQEVCNLCVEKHQPCYVECSSSSVQALLLDNGFHVVKQIVLNDPKERKSSPTTTTTTTTTSDIYLMVFNPSV